MMKKLFGVFFVMSVVAMLSACDGSGGNDECAVDPLSANCSENMDDPADDLTDDPAGEE